MRHTRSYKITALVLALVLGLTACSKTPSGGEGQPTPAPEATPSYDKEDETSNLGLWARAMGSILMSMNEGNVYYFGGYEKNEFNMEAAQTILEQSWSIKTRKNLVKQIKILTKRKENKKYLKEAKEVNSYTANELKSILKELPEENRRYYSLVQYNWEKWQDRGMLAWDLCRVSHLAQWGFLAGFITIEEAQAIIEPAAKKLQKRFTSWEEVQMNWLDGYALWAEVDMDEQENEYLKRKEVYESLVAGQEENGLLYDDSLFSTEIIPVEGHSYKDLFGEVKSSKKANAASGAAVATDGAVKEE